MSISEKTNQEFLKNPTTKTLLNTYDLEDVDILKYKNYEKEIFSCNCQHTTQEIGKETHMKKENHDRSTFSSVVKYIEVRLLSFFNSL